MGVEAIGGLFFRSRDPGALKRWYQDRLGVGAGLAAPGAGEAEPWVWMARGGPLVFEPFTETSDYFPADRRYMLNLRVTGLDALVADLRAHGVAVETRAEWDSPEFGRFARVHDPEDNPVELWEPHAPTSAEAATEGR